MSSKQGLVSHGRGGAANIGPDTHAYEDGEIIRIGKQDDRPHHAGRGGAGNVEKQHAERVAAHANQGVVPETAKRVDKEQSHHFGIGGAGNEEHTHSQQGREDHKGDGNGQGLADKLKEKVMGGHHKQEDEQRK